MKGAAAWCRSSPEQGLTSCCLLCRRKRSKAAGSSQTEGNCLDALRCSKLQGKDTQVALWKTSITGGQWLVTGGILPEGKLVDCTDVKRRFRWFTLAAVLYDWMEMQSLEPLSFDSVDELIVCVIAALTEDPGNNSKRRFAVYRSIAGFLGIGRGLSYLQC
ncbi:hypothetical protein R1sor_023849 [Riccia sorocarpa]|uniref:Uncharacterized protein n=1 Tax=Riccia sorocarpa TaxID=122646 RepID=A0ABD3GNY7_9MARC